MHLLAAYLPEEGVVLAQVDLKRWVVCGDARHTQRELSVKIMAAGGEHRGF